MWRLLATQEAQDRDFLYPVELVGCDRKTEPSHQSPQASIIKRYGLDEIKVTISVLQNKRKKVKKKKNKKAFTRILQWEVGVVGG